MARRTISGVLPILHTPFQEDDTIDLSVLQSEVNWALSVGAHGMGTAMVSELLRLTAEERISLTHALVEMVAGRGITFVSVGAESTGQAVHYAKVAQQAGIDAIMAIPPLTTRLPPASLCAYYCAIADAVDLPLIVQDASGYVGQPIPLSVSLDLLEKYGEEKILFKPEANPVGPNLSALRDGTGGRAKVFEGSGGIYLVDSYCRGIVGTMPGMDLLDGVVALWNALEQNDDETAYRLYAPICAIVALQLQAGLDGFLAIEKYLMVQRGIFKTARRRGPYNWELDDETAAEVDRLFAHMTTALQQSPLAVRTA